MSDEYPKFTAAAVQAAPRFLDREGTIDKACELIEEASGHGARLIVFPETWVPTYPFWDMQRPDAWLELHRWTDLNRCRARSPAQRTFRAVVFHHEVRHRRFLGLTQERYSTRVNRLRDEQLVWKSAWCPDSNSKKIGCASGPLSTGLPVTSFRSRTTQVLSGVAKGVV